MTFFFRGYFGLIDGTVPAYLITCLLSLLFLIPRDV